MDRIAAKTRSDGRSDAALRPLTCELACLKNSDGSALWKSGSTHVLCSVQGPVAPRLVQHEESSSAVLSVIIKAGGSNVQNVLEYEWEDFLTRVLTACLALDDNENGLYPRCIIQVVLQIISVDGSVLSACLHAAVSALMDAGIEMKYLPTAATCLLTHHPKENGDTADASATTIQLDPSALEEDQDSNGVIVISVAKTTLGLTDSTGGQTGSSSSDDHQVLACHTSGISCTMERLLQCIPVAARANAAVLAFWRLAMEQKAKRESQTLWSN